MVFLIDFFDVVEIINVVVLIVKMGVFVGWVLLIMFMIESYFIVVR